MWKEFKEFAFKGNVLDMSIGVIIGGAFGKIVSSLVSDIIMPFFGFLTAGTDFTALKLVLSPAELNAAGEVIKAESAILYGNFIQNVFDFFIVAFCIFLFVQQLTKVRKKKDTSTIKALIFPKTDDALKIIISTLQNDENVVDVYMD